MLTVNTDAISLIDSERGPSGPANPRFEIKDLENGVLEVSFKFNIYKEDRWSLSVSKGIGKEKKSFGFGQGSTHQEHPEKVIERANEWLKESKDNEEFEESHPGVIVPPPSFWDRDD